MQRTCYPFLQYQNPFFRRFLFLKTLLTSVFRVRSFLIFFDSQSCLLLRAKCVFFTRFGELLLTCQRLSFSWVVRAFIKIPTNRHLKKRLPNPAFRVIWMFFSIKKDWCAVWPSFKMRWIDRIEESILHTHNVTRKCVKKFLEPFEFKNFAKKWQNPEISKPHFGIEKMDFPTLPSFCALSLRLMHRMITN